MNARVRWMMLAALMGVLPVWASAQVTYEGCLDAFGRPVASVLQPSINDVAVATLSPMGPVILYNPAVVAAMRPQTRLFFYVHECAHHNLGHTLGNLHLAMEQHADCWAVRVLVARGVFGPADVQAVQQDIARFGKADWLHLPGPMRAMNLMACLM